MTAARIRRPPSTTSTAAAWLCLSPALVATLCALAGCAGSGLRSIVAGDALFGEVVSHSFRGGAGSIIFEDGTVLRVVAHSGAYT